MSQTSVIYRNAALYEAIMRVLYGRHYRDRLAAVAAQVPDGATVVELCCGPGTLYERHLRGHVAGYVGLDVNPGFVERLRTRGIEAQQADLARSDTALPHADVLLIQASLYHFLPAASDLIDRMLAAAHSRVIVAEPVRNLASSERPLIGRLGRRAADPGVGGHAERFDETSLAALMAAYPVIDAAPIPGGREMVYVLDASSTSTST